MTFWIIITALSICVTALLILALRRGRKDTAPAAAFDLKVYRDQLREVDRDYARGVLQDDDAERLKTEISRRILTADKAMQETHEDHRSPKALRFGLMAVLVAVLVGGGLFLYRDLGAPGYGDLSLKDRIETAKDARANRPNQETAEQALPAPIENLNAPKDYITLVTKLREAVASRPNDLAGAQLLARHEMALGNAKAAYTAQQGVLRIKGDQTTAEDYATYADMLVIAAGGYVSPEAEAALQAALIRDRTNGPARYYTGLMMAQTGRPDVAFRTWATLLQSSASDDPWTEPLRAQIEDMAFRAGVEYTLPDLNTMKGPTAEDVEASRDMTPEDRQEMIKGMVDQLSSRLGSQGGSAEEWARLIGALTVLGETERASAILTEARTVFAAAPDALAMINAAAQRAGVASE